MVGITLVLAEVLPADMLQEDQSKGRGGRLHSVSGRGAPAKSTEAGVKQAAGASGVVTTHC